jgi:hypothetical protein
MVGEVYVGPDRISVMLVPYLDLARAAVGR